MNHFIYRKKRKILLAAISMGVLAASISAFHGPEAVYAYTATAGTINDGPVKVRNAPVTGDKLTLLYPGNAVTVTMRRQDQTGIHGARSRCRMV